MRISQNDKLFIDKVCIARLKNGLQIATVSVAIVVTEWVLSLLDRLSKKRSG